MKRRQNWILYYTIMFMAVSATILLCFRALGKSMIVTGDSYDQHVTAIRYVSDFWKTLFTKGPSAVKLVDFSLGQGMDVFSSLSYYGLFDLFYLPSLFFSLDDIDACYAFIVLLRMYATGLAFGAYIRYIGAKQSAAIACACITYAFSGFMVIGAPYHPYFANGPFFLALCCLGVEALFRTKRPGALIASVAFMLITNFYFAYMNTLLLILYISVRLCVNLKARGVAESARDGFRMLGAYVLGALISAVVFLPSAYAYFQNSRVFLDTGYQNMLHFPFGTNVATLSLMFAPKFDTGDATLTSFIPIAFFAVCAFVVDMLDKKRCALEPGGLSVAGRKTLLITSLLMLVMAFIPFFSKLMNGMGYVSNRWYFSLALPVSICVAFYMDRLLKPDKRLSRALGVCAALWALACAGVAIAGDIRLAYRVSLSICALALLAGGAYLIARGRRAQPGARALNRLRAGACALTVLLAMGYSCYFYINARELYMPRGDTAPSIYAELPVNADLLAEDGFYRIATEAIDDNHASILGYHGTGFYWSITPGLISDSLNALGLSTLAKDFHLRGYDDRAPLLTLAAVKYKVSTDAGARVPYGFKLISADGARALYENEYALPLGYTYGAYLPKAAYQALDSVQKQEALMKYAVIDTPSGAPALPEMAYASDMNARALTVSGSEGVEFSGGGFTTQANAYISFSIPEDAWRVEGESYLLLTTFYPLPSFIDTLALECGELRAEFKIRDKQNIYQLSRDSLVLPLGRLSERARECKLSFNKAGSFILGDVVLYTHADEAYARDASKLMRDAPESIYVGVNRVTCALSISENRFLQFSIPGIRGWTARVNGEQAQLIPSGGHYMGLMLKPGDYDIELTYMTPGLKAGICISGAALIMCLALWITRKRRARNK